MSNDQVIVGEIRATLKSDPRIHNPAELAVSEKAGTVTLRGTVRSLHQRRTVVEIASSVRGVRAVEDELRVDLRDHWTDEELRGTALQDEVLEGVGLPRAGGGLDHGVTARGNPRERLGLLVARGFRRHFTCPVRWRVFK